MSNTDRRTKTGATEANARLPSHLPVWYAILVAERRERGASRAKQGRAFERLLRSDPELLRSLIDQAADAVCLHEIGGRILDVNQRMCATLGYTREELLSLSVLDLDVTATREETAEAAMQLVPGQPATGDRVLRRKDGSTLPIELSLSLIVSGGKQLMLGIARDITDRKRAEQAQAEAQRVLEQRVRERTEHLEIANRRLEAEIGARERSEAALRESEERFRALAERGHLLAWEADADTWQFTYVGPQARDLLGYPVEAWYRPNFWVDHIHPDDRERTIEYCRSQSTVALDYEFEYRMRAADGRYAWLQDIVHVIRDAKGPRTLRGFMIDVTARKRAEEARQLLLRELDHRVKNTLAMVQAVAELTLRTAESLDGFGETFRGRIGALARMHAAIWRNKGAPIRLARAGRARPGAVCSRGRARFDRGRRGFDPGSVSDLIGVGSPRARHQRRQARCACGEFGERAREVGLRCRPLVLDLARSGRSARRRSGASRIRLGADRAVGSLRARRLCGARLRAERRRVHDHVPARAPDGVMIRRP